MEDDGEAWESCIYYNLNLMQSSIDFFDALVWVLILSELLLDILCYKYRHLAKYYIYVHVLHFTVTKMLPNPQIDVFAVSPVQIVFIYGAINLVFYCDQPLSFVFQTVFFNFHFFFTCAVLYYQELTIMRVVTVFWLNFSLMMSVVFFSIAVFYVYQLQKKITSTN